MNNKFYLKVNILLLNRLNSMILSTCCLTWSDFMGQQFKKYSSDIGYTK